MPLFIASDSGVAHVVDDWDTRSLCSDSSFDLDDVIEDDAVITLVKMDDSFDREQNEEVLVEEYGFQVEIGNEKPSDQEMASPNVGPMAMSPPLRTDDASHCLPTPEGSVEQIPVLPDSSFAMESSDDVIADGNCRDSFFSGRFE